MKKKNFSKILSLFVVSVLFASVFSASAQDLLPADNGLEDYHTQPRWRESESHPLRILAYVVHPFGWLAREVVFRPLSYFASSSETRRSVSGFREPYDYRQPECFSADDSTPDCRTLRPYDYAREDDASKLAGGADVFFPDVNFDFNSRRLNPAGRQQTKEIYEILKTSPVNVVLEGHTDYIGSTKYNEALGLDRAEAVKAELAKLGIAQDKISTVTFGETKPKNAEKTTAARAVNRRVEVQTDAVK